MKVIVIYSYFSRDHILAFLLYGLVLSTEVATLI